MSSSVIKLDIPAIVRMTIIKRLLPDEVVDLVQEYAHGKCVWFALALSELSNNPDLCVFSDEDGVMQHTAVIANEKLYDAYGRTSVAEVCERYCRPKLQALRVPAADLFAQLTEMWKVERAPAVAAVRRLAKYHKWPVK